MSFKLRTSSRLDTQFLDSRSKQRSHGGVRNYSVLSLVDSVIEEMEAIQGRKRAISAAKLGLLSDEELVVDKPGKWVLQKSLLLEFRKDSNRLLLAVAQKPDGKKNWMVTDQNGATSSIKPQQVTYIVPGVENFNHMEILNFIEKADKNLDSTLLEYAWAELLEQNKSVTAEEFAEINFGSMEPLESYCAHLLLSKDETYFSVVETKGSYSVNGRHSTVQVEELLRSKRAKEAAERELQEFVQLLKSAKLMPPHTKPPKESWTIAEKTRHRIESLQTYAIDTCNDDQKRTAGLVKAFLRGGPLPFTPGQLEVSKKVTQGKEVPCIDSSIYQRPFGGFTFGGGRDASVGLGVWWDTDRR